MKADERFVLSISLHSGLFLLHNPSSGDYMLGGIIYFNLVSIVLAILFSMQGEVP
jgi:hypothetical protein